MHAGARLGRPAAVAVAALLLACAATLLDAATVRLLSDGAVAMLACAAAAAAVGALCPTPLAALACAAGAGLLTAANQVQNPGSYSAGNDAAFFLVLLGGPALVGAIWGARTRQIRALHRASAALAAQREADLRTARLEEQSRVAATVQYGVIQTMGAIVVQSDGARRGASTDEAATALAAIELSARQALDELREHVGVLREPAPYAADVPEPVDHAGRPPLGPLDLLAGLACVPVAIESVFGGASRGPAWANVLVALTFAAPLVIRRRRPIAAAAVLGALAALMSLWLTPMPAIVTITVPLLLLAYAVGAHTRGWRDRLIGSAVLVVGVLVVAWASPPASRDPDGLLPTLLWLVLGVLSGVAAAGRADRVRRLDATLAAVEHGRDADVRLAAAEQRHAIASDLHDSVAAAMTVVCLHAGAARGLGPDARNEALETIGATARAGLAELRASLDLLDDASAPPALDVATVVADARRAGMSVSLAVVGEVPAATITDAARIVREALVNAARHAPGAAVTVRVACAGDRVEVEVVDTGTARAEPAPYGHGTGRGLQGLAERLGRDGGSLEFGPLSPGGFRVGAVLRVAVGQSA